MPKINKNGIGMAVGGVSALMHLFHITLLTVLPETYINYIAKLHGFAALALQPIDATTAVMGIILAFVSMYIVGWVAAWICNKTTKT